MSQKDLTRKLDRALTVADLIAELEQYPADARVVFACDYGDHYHTQQALPVEHVEEQSGTVVESAYSYSGLALREPDEDDEEEGGGDGAEQSTVIVLR